MQETKSPRPSRLVSIELLRGIAATMVIFSHVARHISRDAPAPDLISLFEPGHAGVDLFFVLSGFIILFVHRPDIGRPARLGHYAIRRFSRVMPLYWIALVLSLGVNVIVYRSLPDIGAVLWSGAMLPTTTEPLLAIAWTLQYEAMFYVCFALLILNRRLGLAAFAVWMLVIISYLGTTWPPALCRVFGLEFLFGILAAQAMQRLRTKHAVIVASVGGVAFAVAYACESTGVMGGFGVLARFAYGVPAAFMICGLAVCESAGMISVPRWLEPLGRASYSIYLFQFLCIGVLWQILRLTGATVSFGPWPLFAILAGGALLGGVIINRSVEQPLLRWCRQPLSPAWLNAALATR